MLGAVIVERSRGHGDRNPESRLFSSKKLHQKIYECIQNLFAKSEPIDILSVTNELRKNGNLELVGGAYYVAWLTNRVGSAANVEFHARVIAEKFIKRELIRVSGEIPHRFL